MPDYLTAINSNRSKFEQNIFLSGFCSLDQHFVIQKDI